MRSLKVQENGKEETYICAHWKVFPPPGFNGNAENLRANGDLDNAQYNRLQLWERDCGLIQMAEDKCLACPHHRKVVWKTRGPHLRAPNGLEVPVQDPAAGEASPCNRHMAALYRRPGTVGSGENASWLKKDG